MERPLPVFDTTGSAPEVAQRWTKWKRSFQYYVEGEGLTSEKNIRSKMLHLAGDAVQDIFETFEEPVVPDGQVALGEYKKALQMLDGYFKCKPNTTFERHSFRQLAQRPGETVNQFVNRLRQQAKLSNFRDENDSLWDQLVETVWDEKLRKKFLECGDDLMLAKALDMDRQYETTEASAEGMRLSGERSRGVGKVTHPAPASEAKLTPTRVLELWKLETPSEQHGVRPSTGRDLPPVRKSRSFSAQMQKQAYQPRKQTSRPAPREEVCQDNASRAVC